MKTDNKTSFRTRRKLVKASKAVQKVNVIERLKTYEEEVRSRKKEPRDPFSRMVHKIHSYAESCRNSYYGMFRI